MIAYKFKLYKTKRQKELSCRLGVACWVYNHSIALHKRYYRLFGKSLKANDLKKHWTKIKKRKPWLKELGSQSLQDVVDRIDRGYSLFFRNTKKGIKSSPPSFKGKRRYSSFTLKQAGWKVDGNQLVLGKQIFKFSKSRELDGEIKTVTLKRDSLGDFYVVFCCEVKNKPVQTTSSKTVGLDFGLKNFLTSNTGEITKCPEFFKKDLAAIRRASRRLSKKQKGSNNRLKARLNLARHHKKVFNKRLDFHHKLARGLALTHKEIYIEDLTLKGMQKLWGRKISDLGFYSFTRILEHHCQKAGSKLIKIDRFYPSSKTCSTCEHVLKELGLKERSWICPSCGADHDRDVNAAKNILRTGLTLSSKRVGVSTLRRGDVREVSTSCFC
jgi:putative transposase